MTPDFDEGNKHLFDLAVADGVDCGRYILVTEPGSAEEAVIAKGPNFHSPRTTDPRLIHIQVWLDALLENQDRT